jgi:murein DD-endopeptidase MepM/ murein hydrolase activator NlpD
MLPVLIPFLVIVIIVLGFASAFALNEEDSSVSQVAATQVTASGYVWPVEGSYRVTSHFGYRTDPLTGELGASHSGMDIGCASNTPILAIAPGTVTVAVSNGAYNYGMGNYVCIDHGGGMVSRYYHNTSVCVSVGQSVTAGQVIAYAGTTGRVTGPHCHLTITVNGVKVNPASYFGLQHDPGHRNRIKGSRTNVLLKGGNSNKAKCALIFKLTQGEVCLLTPPPHTPPPVYTICTS